MLKKFNLQAIREGDFKEVQKTFTDVKEKRLDGQEALYAIDAACANPEFLANFTEGFSKEWNSKKHLSSTAVKFRALTDDELETQYSILEKKFDINQTSITPTIATTVIPSIESLIRSTALLSRINIVRVGGQNSFYQMFDFDSEQNAAILSEVAAGSDVDEVLRNGDRVIPNQKVQASMKMTEFSLGSLDGNTLGKYLARLAKRVQNQLCVAILANGSGAANGTARGDNVRGILNNYGINGTGDASNSIGAIAYATKAATDAAIVAAGGGASSDAYDLVVKAKSFLLPSNIIDVEEDEYIFLGNRNSWGAIRTVKDGNGRYLAYSAIDNQEGKPVKIVDDTEFMVVPSAQCPNSRVYLFPPKMYTLFVKGDLMNLNDGGLVQLREGITQFVSRTWVSGSMEYGHKFRPATAITTGVTVPDNNEQNAFRVFNLV